ncbi:unnamed protein product, partial [marine sediment metagenome]
MNYKNTDKSGPSKLITVTGEISCDDVDIISPHEHVLIDIRNQFTGFEEITLRKQSEQKVTIEKIDKSTIEELNSRFLKTLKPGYFKKVLKDKCKIATSLLNVETLDREHDPKEERSIYCDRNLYSPVYTISDCIFPNLWSIIDKLEKQSGVKITSFNCWLEAVEALINKAYKLGAVALKNPLAYQRTLKYERTSGSRAEEEFNSIFKVKHFGDWIVRPISTEKNFQDYMFHFILDIANKKNLIIQVHTGIQEGNGNILSNSNPELLSNLFLE